MLLKNSILHFCFHDVFFHVAVIIEIVLGNICARSNISPHYKLELVSQTFHSHYFKRNKDKKPHISENKYRVQLTRNVNLTHLF